MGDSISGWYSFPVGCVATDTVVVESRNGNNNDASAVVTIGTRH